MALDSTHPQPKAGPVVSALATNGHVPNSIGARDTDATPKQIVDDEKHFTFVILSLLDHAMLLT
jgi:hypothetical protein